MATKFIGLVFLVEVTNAFYLNTEAVPIMTTPPNSCYPPNSDISQGQSGNWCYGTYCDSNGQIIHWDNWQCESTTATEPTSTTVSTTTETITTVPTTTLPTTTVPTTMEPTTMTMPPTLPPGGCYPPNSDISQGQSGNWCYGTYCDSDGQIIHWDNFSCGTTTTTEPTSTTVPTSMAPTTIVSPTTVPTTVPITTVPTTTIPTTTIPITVHPGYPYTQ